MKKILIVFLFLFSCVNLFSEEAYIGVFNAERLGDSGKKDYAKMASLISGFDIVGIVEVFQESGLEKLVDELNKNSDIKWDYHISNFSVGSKKHKEYFGYIYRKDKVKFLKSNGFFKKGRSSFLREPYGADFKVGEFDFTFVLVHTIYGNKISQRRSENKDMVDVYNYFQDKDEFEQDIILAGDFNIYAYDYSFKPLREHKDKIENAVDVSLKTTVGHKGLANSYDNFFYSTKYTKEYTGKSGVIDLASKNPTFYRKNISDHIPVFIIVDTLEDDD